MISYSSRILKAGTVAIDHENKVVIEVPQTESEFAAPMPINEEERAMNEAARIIRTAEMQANEILNRARMEALAIQSTIESETKEEAAKLLKETRESAYNDAMDIATEEGNRIIDDAKRVLHEARKEREFLQESLEPDIIKLVINITDKIIGNAVKLNPSVICHLVKQGLKTGAATGDVKILVSATDIDEVKAAKNELLALTDGSANVEIVLDHSLGSFDCIIETSFGHIDCSLDQQYSALKENLTYILQNRG